MFATKYIYNVNNGSEIEEIDKSFYKRKISNILLKVRAICSKINFLVFPLNQVSKQIVMNYFNVYIDAVMIQGIFETCLQYVLKPFKCEMLLVITIKTRENVIQK